MCFTQREPASSNFHKQWKPEETLKADSPTETSDQDNPSTYSTLNIGNQKRQHGGLAHIHTDMEREQNEVKRFLKLGYSRSDIVRVLQTLEHDAQTNDILQELIRTCRTKAAGTPGAPESSPQLVPRGCGSSVQQNQADTTHADSHSSNPFRPVVIDGSNVAIR